MFKPVLGTTVSRPHNLEEQVIVENRSHEIAGGMPMAAVGAIRQMLSDARQ